MFCPECGKHIEVSHHFCPNCGKKNLQESTIFEPNNDGSSGSLDGGPEVVEVAVEPLTNKSTNKTRKKVKKMNDPQGSKDSTREGIIALIVMLLLFFGGCAGCAKISGCTDSGTRGTVFWYEMIDERTQTVDVYWGGDRPVTHVTIKSGGKTLLSKPVNPPLENGKIRIRKPYDNVGLEYDWRH